MTRTVSARTDGADQSEGVSPACSPAPSLTRTNSVQGLSLVAAHPNRVVSLAPTVTGSGLSATRPQQAPPPPNSRMHPKNRKGSQLNPTVPLLSDFGVPDCGRFGLQTAHRRRSTSSIRSLYAAQNLDIQRVRGGPQVWPKFADFCFDESACSNIQLAQIEIPKQLSHISILKLDSHNKCCIA